MTVGECAGVTIEEAKKRLKKEQKVRESQRTI